VLEIRPFAKKIASTGLLLVIAGTAVVAMRFGPFESIWFFGGAFAAAFNLVAWRLALKTFTSHLDANANAQESFLGAVAFLLKVPIVVGLGFWARTFSETVLATFLSGFGLVYFLFVWWAYQDGRHQS
jgi:hypothetical protein